MFLGLLSTVLLNGMMFTSQQLEVNVQFYTPEIVRVYKTPVGHPYDKQSIVVQVQPDESVVVKKHQEGDMTMLTSQSLQVQVNTKTGGIDFYTCNGRHLLKNKDYGTSFLPKHGMYEVRESFLVEPDEPVYGIGQVMDGHFSRRHQTHHLQNENMFTYSPYFLSPKGYAVFLDNYSISDYSDTPQDLSFQSLGHCDDYYFIYGGTADGVISGVRHLTGHSPMLPLWAYGFFQSRERYVTQNESLDVLRRYRQLHVPIDCMIQDWRYWPQWNGTDSLWNSQTFDPGHFPTPKKWVDEIHRLHAKLLIVTWPGLGAHTPQHHELDSLGMLINFKTFPDQSGAKPYDVFNPQARDIFWKYLDRGVFSAVGNDGWRLDSTEPDHIDRQESDFDLPTYSGPYRGVKNLFSYMHNKGIAEHQKAQYQNKRVVILTRSGFVGQQRFGSNTWSGDVYSTWRDLTNQIPAALNFTLMGLPYWNSDIGGFWANEWSDKGGCRNPEFQELYVRWMQFGLFCPMMRSHGTGLPREIFQFGERGNWCFDAQERAICLRYRLLPYIYSTAWDVSTNNSTFMRPLLMDFANDRRTYKIGNEYLFGRQMLVAPVTRYQATTWDTYLPAGTKWWNFWTNQQVDGGQTLSVPVTRSELPVFVKAGTILPFGPAVQYTTEQRWDNMEVRIYPGADGTFTLYEDENDNYNYEHGAYTTITFRWDDTAQLLTVGNQTGSFKGMLKKRKFQIVLVGPDSGIGDQPMHPDKTISYSGKQISVKL